MLPRHWMEAYINFLLKHRYGVIVAVLLFTVFLGYNFLHMRVTTDFFDLYPPNHPYIQLYQRYRRMFGTANVLVMALEVKKGTIFNVETLNKLNRITLEIMNTPGVNTFQVLSLAHPTMKSVRITQQSISTFPVFYPGPPRNDKDVAGIKNAVYTNEGIRGFYVSEDDTAVLLTAGFWEEGVDFARLYNRFLEIQEKEQDDNHVIYLTGFPMLYAWVYSYKTMIIAVIGVTALVMVLLLWLYFRTVQGVVIPLFSGLMSALWALGFAGLFGFSIDPLVLVALVVITARALSHSVQSMERYHEEYRRLRDKQQAILTSYLGLFSPALVSIASDGLAILTLAIAHIPLIQKLAYVSAFWVFTISISVVTLHPIILSFVQPPRHDPKAGKRFSDHLYTGINRALVKIAYGTPRYVVVSSFVILMVGSMFYAQKLKIGDVSVGKALLYEDHGYNVSYDRVNEKFVGASQLVVIAEGKEEGVIKDPRVLVTLEKFQRYMEKQDLVGGSLTVTNMVRNVFQMLQEGIPKWAVIPDDPRHVGNVFFLFMDTGGADQLERLIDKDFRNASITIYYRDHTYDTVMGSLAMAKEFIAQNSVDGVNFRLAGGLLGILAAINEEVDWSYKWNLVAVLITVFVLSFLTYASAVGALIVMIPSIVAQPLSEAFMYLSGIDANINSLPVAAIGIGIGIDYGYYVLSRIVEEYGRFGDYDRAIEEALMTTGRAIMFTGTTLIASVIFWVFFPMKFQAQMAMLLALLLFFHVMGALAFIPAIVSLIKPRFPLPPAVAGQFLLALVVGVGVLYAANIFHMVTLGMLALLIAGVEYGVAQRLDIVTAIRK